MDTERQGYLYLVLFSFLISGLTILVKLIEGLTVHTLVFFRAVLAAGFILGILLIKQNIKQLRLVHPRKTILVGLFQAISIFLLFAALVKTTVSSALFLLYTAPIFSVLFARIIFKEKIERATIIGLIVTFAGIAFVFDPATFSFGSDKAIGNLFALGAGFFDALMLITAKSLMKDVSGYYAVFWQYLITSVLFLFFVRVDSVSILLQHWWQLSLIGVVCTGIAFVLFMEGVKRVKAQKALIVATLEPLLGSVLALLILKEVPSLFTFIGACLILYGVYYITTKKETTSSEPFQIQSTQQHTAKMQQSPSS